MSQIVRTRTLVMIIQLISIVLLLSLTHIPVRGDIVWKYTFDSGLPSDWWITNGNVTVQDGYLTATDCLDPNSVGYCTVSLWLNSTARTGQWSLDYSRGNGTNIIAIFFMAQGMSEANADHWPEAWNRFVLLDEDETGDQLEFGSLIGTQRDVFTLATFNVETDWIRIDITRNEIGEMNLYIDKEHIATKTGGINTSEFINLQFAINDRVDNFTYYDSIEGLTPPESSGLTTPESSDTNETIFYVVGGISGIGILIYSTRFIIKKKVS